LCREVGGEEGKMKLIFLIASSISHWDEMASPVFKDRNATQVSAARRL
jgi:hypothetical protein